MCIFINKHITNPPHISLCNISQNGDENNVTITKVIVIVNDHDCYFHYDWNYDYDVMIIVLFLLHEEQGYLNGESTHLPPTWPRSDSRGFYMICGLSLLVLYSASRGFSQGTLVFPSPQKTTFDLICSDFSWFVVSQISRAVSYSATFVNNLET